MGRDPREVGDFERATGEIVSSIEYEYTYKGGSNHLQESIVQIRCYEEDVLTVELPAFVDPRRPRS